MASDDDHILDIRVVPRSSRSEIVGRLDGALKVKLAAPPVDGAANAELVKLLAKAFGTARSNVEIIAGETSKHKRVRITGVSQADIDRVLSHKS